MQISQDLEVYFASIQDKKVEEADDLQIIVQLILHGAGGGKFVLHLNRGRVAVAVGQLPKPNFTVAMSIQDFILLTRNEIDPLGLVLKGRISFDGDRLLAMRVATIMQNL
ncbi:MAG: SCP2 sterol-binding domain-containing protein [Chloroflexota bacterium]